MDDSTPDETGRAGRVLRAKRREFGQAPAAEAGAEAAVTAAPRPAGALRSLGLLLAVFVVTFGVVAGALLAIFVLPELMP